MTFLDLPLRVLDPGALPPGPGRGHSGPLAVAVRLPLQFTVVRPADPAVDDPAPPRVLLVTEGTYPFQWGGVSTWCEALIAALPEVRFHLLAIEAYESAAPVFELPANVVDLHAVPLWGLQDVKETWREAGFSRLHASRRATTNAVLEAEFVPVLRRFLHGIFTGEASGAALAGEVHAIYRFLVDHDMNRTLRSRPVWQAWLDEATAAFDESAGFGVRPLALWELTTGFQWLSRWLFPLARPLPEVDVVHAAMAGVCSMVACVAKLEYGAGFFLTEHGVYLRERYLAEAERADSHFLKLLGLRYARRMTEMSYELADQISPCCDYNQRWELEAGATPGQLETIYYGVDSADFDAPCEGQTGLPRCVVWVGRINPLKDVETLLRAAAIVVRTRPDVTFRLYGSAPAEDADYEARCLALHEELGLDGSVVFCGYTSDPAAAYREGDIVTLSSVSEGFPFSTLEAMLCGRPIVATSVGGIPEQIEGAGIAVEPRDPAALAAGLLALLDDPLRCRSLGVAARERAQSKFAASRFRGAHYASYLRMSPRHSHWEVVDLDSRLQPVAPHPPRHLRSGSASSLDKLATEVRRRDPHPVDALEVAALIESAGVTDVIAAESYGYADTFRLADDVLGVLAAGRTAPDAAPDAAPDDVALPGSRLDTARHPMLALLPSIALLTAIWAFSTLGRWSGHQVLALTIGMTVGMLSTNGLSLAMGRRASMLISLGRISATRRFFLACGLVGLVSTAAVSGCLLLVPWRGLAFLTNEPATFVLAALALATVWLLAGTLSLLSVSGWTGVALAAGVVSGMVLAWCLAPLTSHHLTAAAALGWSVTVGLMLFALERSLRSRPTTLASAGSGLPSRGYLILEGLPYFWYGTFGVVIFFSVHLVGWVYLSPGSAGLTTLELGLFLPLAPTLLGAGLAERSLRRFWVRAAELQRTTPANTPHVFGAQLDSMYDEERQRYLRGLGLMSVSTLVVGEVLILTGWLRELTGYTEAFELQLLFVTSLLAYAVLGAAQFSAMFSLSWARCAAPLVAVVTGAVVTVFLALSLAALLGYAWVGPALFTGAACYGVLAELAVRRLFGCAHFYYPMAL